MPVEILPEGNPDWIEYSAKAGILFLDIDPFWKTKTGGDPNLATMYRGGLGFFDQSTDGGRTWSTIVPSTDPPWFTGGENMWDSVYNKFEPMPRPANGAPSYDNQITAPTPSLLRYQSYSGSSARTGEHVVLCAYNVADAAGYLNQGDSDNELELGWVLYTFDDWATHGWHQILLGVDRGISPHSQGTLTNIRSDATNIVEGPHTVKVGTGKFAVLWKVGTTVHCTNVSESGGVFSVDGTASQSGAVLFDTEIFSDSAGHVYCGSIEYEDDGGDRRYKAHVSEWDCSGATPSFVATVDSAFLPDYTPSSSNTFAFASFPFYLTPSGRLAFIYGVWDNDTLGASNPRKWYWFYYNTSSDTFSSTTEFYNGTADTDDIPWGIDISCVAIDGGNKVAVSYIENLNWAGRGEDDYFGSTFIFTVGTWTKADNDEWLNELDSTPDYNVGIFNSKEWSGNRFGFYPSINSVVREARMYTYTTSPDTLTYLPNSETFDNGDRGGRCMREDPADVIGYVGDNMHWSDDTIFPDNSVEISDDRADVRAGFGDASQYIQVSDSYFSTTWKIDVWVITVPPKRPDDMFSRYHISSLAYDADGNYVFLTGHDYFFTTGGPDDMETNSDRFQRNPSHLPANSIGYLDNFATGWQWTSWDDSYTKAQLDAGDTYVGNRAWFGETNGILFYGKLYGISDPTQPAQCWGWESSGGWFEIWNVSAFTDPCRWFIDISNRLYAVAEAGSGLKLYEAKATMVDDGNNMIFVSNVSLDDANHGNIMALDGQNDSIVVAGGSADLIMVVVAAPPWTSWLNLTFSHRNDRGITGMVVMD